MSTSPNPKRKREEEIEESIPLDLDGILNQLKYHGGRELITKTILELMCCAGLTLSDLKKHSESMPAATWEAIAHRFELDALKDVYQLDIWSFPIALLPPSFHRGVMKISAKWLDVYQERLAQDKEAAPVRLMDAWHVPVCALFKGRLVDRPEVTMPESQGTSGGEVEHEVYTLEGHIILLVVKMKFSFEKEMDNIAQVLLELSSAYKLNSDKDFKPQSPVYAILTDLRIFYFFRYDGFRFARAADVLFVPDGPRPAFLAGMQKVTEHLFSILLEGYIGTLTAVEKQSRMRGVNNDVSTHSSAESGKENIDLKTPGKPRPSLDNWSKALQKAHEAQHILTNCKRESLDSWEEVGCRGLSSLAASVFSLPKVGSSTDWDDKELDEQIEIVLSQVLLGSSSRSTQVL